METKRSTNPAAEEILTRYFPVLDHGFVSLVDYMGTDVDIETAARVSYGAGTRKTSETRGLIRYLRRHKHCYAPDMEVLTARGWLRWDDCEATETFLVPDPETRTLRAETLALEVFAVEDEDMECFRNDRMSYRVTSDHRMWFKKKFQGTAGSSGERFEIVRAKEMARWGHFDPAAGYALFDFAGEKDPRFQLTGFYLGDGSYGSSNRIIFHLRKDRKKDYLVGLLRELGIPYDTRQSSTYPDATVFTVETPNFLRDWLGDHLPARCREKELPLASLCRLDAAGVRGLWDGLAESDAHRKVDREQVDFYSESPSLRRLFDATSAMLGVAAHAVHDGSRVVAYFGERTSLEARKQSFSTACFTGKVYCATTSTGLLMVRGAHDEFGFVCGNTTPSEMVELKFHCCMPIFIARQWIRHRTANVNEMSGRYSLLPMVFYTPDAGHLQTQSKTNKQGQSGDLVGSDVYAEAVHRWNLGREEAAGNYEWLNANDVARELARIDLPLSTYTQWYWKIDLHNLLHFLTLRVDSHAQYEIRAFGQVMAGMLKRVAPLSYEAWIDYDVCGERMSRMEMEILRNWLLHPEQAGNVTGLAGRELDEFSAKLRPKAVPDFELDLSKAVDGSVFEQRFAGPRA